MYTINCLGTQASAIVKISPQCLLLALIVAVSQSFASQEAPVEKRKDLATLEGRAVNAVTGEPLVAQGITLRALPPGTGSLIVQSDAEGRFTFEDMEPGSYVLCVRAFGDDGMPLKLSAGQVLKDVELKVTPTGSIRGLVVDGEGKPLPDVLVNARGGSVVTSGMVGRTNNAGEFRLPGLVSGSYVLVASPVVPPAPTAPTGAGEPKTEERLLTTYYPAAADAAGAVLLEVAPGQELQGIMIVIRKGRLYHVLGTVMPSPPDILLADVRLMLIPRTRTAVDNVVVVALGDDQSGTRTPKRDGSFNLGGVRPGSYYLTATRQNVPNVTLGHVPVDVYDADVDGVVLRIGEPRKVHGAVRMEGQDKPDFTGVRVQLRLLDNLIGRLPPVAILDAENTFALKDVPPDRHLVAVTGLPEKAYLKSIQLGGQEAIDSGLDLTDMQTVPPLDILISPNGATIEGTVTVDDYKPAPGAWVCLVPEPPRLELTYRIKSATATGDGRFSFAGVAPGEYRLYALDRLKRDPYGDLEFLKPFESSAMKLTVKEGERKRIDLIVRAVAQ